MNSRVSIYIPRMSTVWTETSIKNIMNNYGLGTVSRVDFKPINKKPGFMSAFIHFSDPVLCADGKYYRTGQPICIFWRTIMEDKLYRLQITNNEYWICLKNKNPIKRTSIIVEFIVDYIIYGLINIIKIKIFY